MNIYEGYYSPYQAFLFSEIKKAMIFFALFSITMYHLTYYFVFKTASTIIKKKSGDV